MRVHVVSARTDEHERRIVPRLALLLAERAGWGCAPRVDGGAAVNLFVPYLNRVNARCETKAAAWFTHREDGSPEKQAMWGMAARQVDLRVTSARIYLADLEHYGAARMVTPPLDFEKFQPLPQRERHTRPIVGTSGWVYQWGRKGERLLGALAQSRLGQAVEWRAAGDGWPVPTRMYDWHRLQEFYQGLDCYVCTSLIEGVGYGPLEALACGVKVVIPSGVGVFDDLPEREGIVHYEAGNLSALERALSACLEDSPDPDELRDVVSGYSERAWVEGWKAAVDELMGTGEQETEQDSQRQEGGAVLDVRPAVAPAAEPRSEPVPTSLPSWRGRAGLYLVAYGEPSRKQALRCIQTFKACNPGIPVALCADRALGPEDILIEQPERDIGARWQKVSIYDLAPSEWEYVAYLDADTESKAAMSALFDWLQDGWELVICSNPGKFAVAANMKRPDNLAECEETWQLWGTDQGTQLQGGVFAFRRCEATARLFARWQAEWERYGKRDQAALLRAIWQEPVRVYLQLPRVWNCVPEYDRTDKAAILHYPQTARRWAGIVAERSDSPEAWARVRQWEHAHGQAQPARARR